MPELPEVETIKRTLINWCKGKTIKDVEIKYEKVLENIDFKDFKRKIINQKINDIERFGKYLFFILDDYVLISHLRMEGKYFYLNEEEFDEYINKHKIISFKLDDKILVYHDVRKFGKMKLVSKDNYMSEASIKKLAKEPFNISVEELYKNIFKCTRTIKQSLLDQSVIAGLGNIYVDEVLYDACIDPRRTSKSITRDECKRIIESAIKILNLAIEFKGSTISSYHFNNNESGNFQSLHKVYGKNGQKCSRCGRVIEKIIIGGRGTHYCPNCQK